MNRLMLNARNIHAILSSANNCHIKELHISKEKNIIEYTRRLEGFVCNNSVDGINRLIYELDKLEFYYANDMLETYSLDYDGKLFVNCTLSKEDISDKEKVLASLIYLENNTDNMIHNNFCYIKRKGKKLDKISFKDLFSNLIKEIEKGEGYGS